MVRRSDCEIAEQAAAFNLAIALLEVQKVQNKRTVTIFFGKFKALE
jgi:hypothetical protein